MSYLVNDIVVVSWLLTGNLLQSQACQRRYLSICFKIEDTVKLVRAYQMVAKQ